MFRQLLENTRRQKFRGSESTDNAKVVVDGFCNYLARSASPRLGYYLAAGHYDSFAISDFYISY